MKTYFERFSLWLARKMHPNYAISLVPLGNSCSITYVVPLSASSVEIISTAGGGGGPGTFLMCHAGVGN